MAEETFKDAIRKWRTEQKWSQGELGEKIGCVSSSGLENSGSASPETVVALKKLFSPDEWKHLLALPGAPEPDVDERTAEMGWTISFRQLVPVIMSKKKLSANELRRRPNITQHDWDVIETRAYIPLSEAHEIARVLGFNGVDQTFYDYGVSEFSIVPRRETEFGASMYAFRHYLTDGHDVGNNVLWGSGISQKTLAKEAKKAEKRLGFNKKSAFSREMCSEYEKSKGKYVPDFQQAAAIIEFFRETLQETLQKEYSGREFGELNAGEQAQLARELQGSRWTEEQFYAIGGLLQKAFKRCGRRRVAAQLSSEQRDFNHNLRSLLLAGVSESTVANLISMNKQSFNKYIPLSYEVLGIF